MLINLQRATREALHYSVLPTEQLQVPEVEGKNYYSFNEKKSQNFK